MKKSLLIVLMSLGINFCTHAQEISKSAASTLVGKHADEIGFAQNDLTNFIVSRAYYDKDDNMQRVYLLQSYKGLPVYNQMIVLAFRNDKLVSKAGSFINKIDSVAEKRSPVASLGSADAVRTAFIKTGVATPSSMPIVEVMENGRKTNYGTLDKVSENVISELLWVPVTEGNNLKVKLAWQVQIVPSTKADWWLLQIDAVTGSLIDKINLTVSDKWDNHNEKNNAATVAPRAESNSINKKSVSHINYTDGKLYNGSNPYISAKKQTANSPFLAGTANYLVIPFPAESPVHPGGTAAIRTNPWTAAPGNATSLGWHNDGATDYTITRGNNVWSTEDRAGTNTNSGIITPTGLPATSSTSPDPLNFNFPPDYSSDATTTTTAANSFRQFAITNLFYWNNIMHDVTYQYGFNEAAANFQASNQGRGGAGGDYVIALAQSAAEGSIGNNANFATPPDGSRARMRMYLFAAVPAITLHVNTPPAVSGDYTAIESAFSTTNKLSAVGPVSGQLVYYNDDAAGATHFACNAPVNSIAGKIALINRGFGGSICTSSVNFTTKVKNAQDAGAIAVIVVNNVTGTPIIMGGGPDNTIVIPAVMISDADGAVLAAQLVNNVTLTLSGTAGVPLDGDLDAGVMCHEYTHGISNRLTGGGVNTSCLGANGTGCANTKENGSEGWSDYLGLMMTTNWTTAQLTDGTNARPIGTYVEGQPNNGSGLRIRPYSTNMTIDPATYSNVGDAAYCSEIHNIGEIWCAAVWDMTWNIIQQQGAINPNLYSFNQATTTGGNSIALKLVLEGMKLQPCNPGFLDSRNAILTADINLYGGTHQCAIWTAFARRGMGWSAVQGSSLSCTDQTAAFDMPPTPAISNQPASVSVCANAPATFSVTATGANLKYNWQVSTNGGSIWNDVAPANTTATLTISSVTPAMNNNQYRCVLTAGCVPTTLNSNAATLTISSTAPSITAQPANAVTCEGNTPVSFTVQTSGTGNVYTWQVNSGSGFVNITAGAPYSGQNTSTLTISPTAPLMNNYQYRVQVSSGACSAPAVSDAATLTVNSLPSISANPQSTSTCIGANTTFSVTAGSAGISYQWQISTATVPAFTNIPSANASTFVVSNATTAMNGNQYRVIVSGICAASPATSAAAILTVITPVTIAAQPPASLEICSGSNNTLTVSGTSSQAISYQWQVNTGTGFTNISNTAPYSGATTATLTISGAAASMNGYTYRALLSNTSCTTPATSAVSALTVRQLPTVGLTATSLSLLPGQSSTLTATPTSSTGGVLSTGWTYNGTALAVTGNTYAANVEKVGAYQARISETWPSSLVCSNSSAVITITATASSKLFIFPSPNDGRFTVSYYNNGGISTSRSVTVYDARGARVEYKNFNVTGPYTLLSVDVRPAQKGIYYIAVGDSGGKVLAEGKVIIQ